MKKLLLFCAILSMLSTFAQSSITKWDYQGGGDPSRVGTNPAGLDTAAFPTPTLRQRSVEAVDLDNDGDMDLIIGTEAGVLFYYQNNGTPTNPLWVKTPQPNLDTLNLSSLNNIMRPRAEDIDNDGDFDLIIGLKYTGWGFNTMFAFNDILFLKNIGTPSNAIFKVDTIAGLNNQNIAYFTGLGFLTLTTMEIETYLPLEVIALVTSKI